MKAHRTWALHITTIRSVPMYIHGSFLFLIAWILFSSADTSQVIVHLLFTTAIFLCVLLHECGHVFTAQMYGIKTRDITLYPFGGIATVLSEPTPKQELLIALAGPLVNIAIAALIYPFTELTSPFSFAGSDSILTNLYTANLTLAVFNMTPALPMDGGRVLRALLALMNVASATTIAARISQVVSIGMGICGIIYNQPLLVVIALFVFLGSFQEMLHSKTKQAVIGVHASDLLCSWEKLYTFTHGTTLSSAMNTALRTTQEYFPILYQGSLLGLTHREDLIRATASSGQDQYISEVMERDFVTVPTTISLSEALEVATEKATDVLPVLDGETFVGFLYPKNITEYMLINRLRTATPPEDPYDD